MQITINFFCLCESLFQDFDRKISSSMLIWFTIETWEYSLALASSWRYLQWIHRCQNGNIYSSICFKVHFWRNAYLPAPVGSGNESSGQWYWQWREKAEQRKSFFNEAWNLSLLSAFPRCLNGALTAFFTHTQYSYCIQCQRLLC